MKKERILQILRFMIGGGIAVVTYFAILYALTEFASVWYVASATIAGIMSFGINFALQKYWTFRNHDRQAIPKQLVWYTVMKLGLLAASTAMLYCLVEYMNLQYLIASAILTVISSAVSYIVTHKIFSV